MECEQCSRRVLPHSVGDSQLRQNEPADRRAQSGGTCQTQSSAKVKMKTPTHHLRGSLLAGFLSIFSFTALGQGWENILMFPAGSGASIANILLDPFSDELSPRRVFVSGYRNDTEFRGTKLLVLDRLTGAYEERALFPDSWQGAIGFDPLSRSLFALFGNGGWEVRKSVDAGTSWSVVDTFRLDPQKDAYPGNFTTDDLGNLYASGLALDASSFGHWIVRKSADQGKNWSIVDNVASVISPPKMHFVAGTNGGLFVASTRNSGSTYSWLVRRSRDAGTTWTTVNTFAGSGSVSAQAITSDASGTVFVAGCGLFHFRHAQRNRRREGQRDLHPDQFDGLSKRGPAFCHASALHMDGCDAVPLA